MKEQYSRPPSRVYTDRMAEPEVLTDTQLISLLTVADAEPNAEPPIIPTRHQDRLIELGYIVDLHGRLRMTALGRIRVADAAKMGRS